MFYNIRLDWDPKVIGVKNGVYQVELDKNAYDKNSYALLDSLFISNAFNVSQANPELNLKFYFKKLKSAKTTSFMSFSPSLNHCHFLVQKNILELFKLFNVQHYRDFDAVIYDSPTENINNSFRLFYLVLQDWDVIDFKNTCFTSGGFGNSPKIEHTFADENELKAFSKIAKVKTLALSKNFNSSLDLFLTRLGGIFVSEKLKLAIEEHNASGIKFNNEVEILI